MSAVNPPEGMARAYFRDADDFGGERLYVWDVDRYPDHRGDAENLGHLRSVRCAPIPEWDAVDRDNPPEWVMAPCHLEMEFVGRRTDGQVDAWSALVYAKPCCSVVYQRHESDPSVMRRVWVRETGCTGAKGWAGVSGKLYEYSDGEYPPVNEVTWSRVHSGDLLPPERIVVPEVDDANQKPRDRDIRYCVSTMRGMSFFTKQTHPGEDEAAHYSLSGHLLGHRVKGEEWKEVSQDAGSPPSPPEPKRKESAPAVAAAMTGYTQSDMPVEAKSFDSHHHHHGPNGVHARRLQHERTYLETNVLETREFLNRHEGVGGFQVMSVSLQDRRPPEAIEQEQREYRDAIRNELARRATRMVRL